MINFAYGSNMSLPRIEARLGEVEVLGRAFITGYKMAFSVCGQDGSGKCDIIKTGRSEDKVWGVLFSLTASQKQRLDGFEGSEYQCIDVATTLDKTQQEVAAYAYSSGQNGPTISAFDWYVKHVEFGARYFDFPTSYVAKINSAYCLSDTNHQRAQRECSIYQDWQATKQVTD